MRSYSASVRPSSRCGAVSGAAHGDRRDGERERLEQPAAVGGAGERVDRVLGVRHQPEHVALLVAHARDVVLRAVGVLPGRVAEHHLLRRRELLRGA